MAPSTMLSTTNVCGFGSNDINTVNFTATSPQRIDLLNRAAKPFFRVIGDRYMLGYTALPHSINRSSLPWPRQSHYSALARSIADTAFRLEIKTLVNIQECKLSAVW